MPIFDQGYQHWNGQLSGHAWRWLAVTRQGVRAGLQSRWVRLLLLMAWIPAVGLAAVLIVWGLIEQKSGLVAPLLNMFKPSNSFVSDPGAFRMVVWRLAYYYFLQVELTAAMILTLLVGPSLISQDLRFNAIPLYFSRPLRRFDYFVGKMGVIGTILAAVAILPAVLAWFLGVLFSLDLSIIKDTFGLLCGAIAYGVVVVLSAGSVMLALSSLSRSSRYVGLFWIGVWFISGVVSAAIIGAHVASAHQRAWREMEAAQVMDNQPPPPGADWQELNRRNRERELRRHEAIMKMQVASMEAARDSWGKLVSFGSNLDRIAETLLDTDAAWQQIDSLTPKAPAGQPQPIIRFSNPAIPWYWSALILACLSGLSLWILTSRVKSLDRLK
jgi:ABC-2 type transport system permease protein